MSQTPRHSPRVKRTFLQKLAANKRLLAPLALILIAGLAAGGYYLSKRGASPEESLANAEKLMQTGDRKGAAIELKNALQGMPGNAQARYLLARLHFSNNDYANAEKELRQAISKGLNSPEARAMLARTLLFLRQPKKVLEEINVTPGESAEVNAQILALRAQSHAMLGDKSNMELSLRQADDLTPDHPDALAVRAGQAYAGGQMEEALTWISKAIAKDAKRADLVVLRADLLRVMKRGDEAMAAYSQALAQEPGNIAARLAVAQQHLAAGQLEKAEAELKVLSAHSPNNLMGRYLEGLIAFRRNNLDVANNKLQEVLRFSPDFSPANLLVGAISLSQGKREQAITHLNRVLEASPDHALARKLLSTAMLASGQTKRAEELISGLKSDADDTQLLALQGNIAMRSGNYKEAREKLEKASALAPENVALMRELAASRMATGDEQGAVDTLEKLAETDTTSHQADVLLVMTHVRAKRYDEALKAIAGFETRHPGLPLAQNLRGIVHLAKNDNPGARQFFAKALSMDAGYLPAAGNLARMDLAQKDIKSARSRFESVLKHDPKNSRAWTALAELANMENKEADYLKFAESAKQADPKNPVAREMLIRHWLTKRDAGKVLVEARAAHEATGLPEFLGHVGAAQVMQNETASAVITFGKWSELSPTNPMAFYRLALAQVLSKDDAAALKSLDKALSLRPGMADASAAKATLLAKVGRHEEALKVARALQASQPKLALGFIAEAEAQLLAKHYAEAAALFVKASQVTNQGAPLARALLAFSAAGKSGEGQKLLEQWLKTHTGEHNLRHMLAQSLLTDKRLAEAIPHYRALVQANPNDVIALNNLAWMLGETRSPEALSMGDRAYKAAPKNPAVLDTYALLLIQAGQVQKAVPLLRDALKQVPDNPEIRWHLADALEKSGNTREALTELDRLLASQTDFPQREEARAKLRQLRSNSR